MSMPKYRIFHFLIRSYFGNRPVKETQRLGSRYGGWHIQLKPELLVGTYIVGGVGEDISFEIELNHHIQIAARLKPKFVMIDPTEKSSEHIARALKNNGTPASRKYSELGKQDMASYNQAHQIEIVFHKKALWNKDGHLSLVAPENPEHVSYSIVGKGKNITSFPCLDILNLMENESEIALIKIDIEGSELNVLTRALDSNRIPAQILVEFDFVRNSGMADWIKFIRLLRKLRQRGYELTCKSGLNISLYKADE